MFVMFVMFVMFNSNFINFTNYNTLINPDNNFEISTDNWYKSSNSFCDILSNSKARYNIDLTLLTSLWLQIENI